MKTRGRGGKSKGGSLFAACLSLCPLLHGRERGGLKSISLCKPTNPESPLSSRAPAPSCLHQRAAMAVAADIVWRQRSPHAFDRQNLKRLSMQGGLTQLPPSLLSLCSPQKCTVCALLPRAEEMHCCPSCSPSLTSAQPPQSKGSRFNLLLSTSPLPRGRAHLRSEHPSPVLVPHHWYTASLHRWPRRGVFNTRNS